MIYKDVIFKTLIVIAFKDRSGIGSFFYFVNFDGDLSILRSFLFLNFRIIANGRGNDSLEPRVDCILLLFHDLASHTHGEFLVRLLKSGDFHAGLAYFLLEVKLNVVASLGIVFYKFSIQFNQLSEGLFIFMLSAMLLFSEDVKNELFLESFVD